jgi:hypothetical protein
MVRWSASEEELQEIREYLGAWLSAAADEIGGAESRR